MELKWIQIRIIQTSLSEIAKWMSGRLSTLTGEKGGISELIPPWRIMPTIWLASASWVDQADSFNGVHVTPGDIKYYITNSCTPPPPTHTHFRSFLFKCFKLRTKHVYFFLSSQMFLMCIYIKSHWFGVWDNLIPKNRFSSGKDNRDQN